MFRRGAIGYGVEVYGGTHEQRRAVFEIQFGDPTVYVDARECSDSTSLFRTALLSIADDAERIEQLPSYSGHYLRQELERAGSNFVIEEFDSLPSDARTSVARSMKAIAEGLGSDEVKLGFTTEEGGSVVHAEPDLRMRVRSWEVDPEALRRGPHAPEADKEDSAEDEASGGAHVGPIVFSDPDARRRLQQNGEVVTFRTSERTTGETWWRQTRTGEKMGNCRVEQIGPIDPANRSALREHYRDAGFESAREWENAIKELNGELVEGHLYRVTSDERWAECESCHEYSSDVGAVGRGPDFTYLCPDCRGPPGGDTPAPTDNEAGGNHAE
ncbi:hypothetical protein ACFQDD_01975 [Halorubrum pallidum]|uniref:Uncharacterized protein n=1 Tax=Halorubrum pallidum TaxID=1526114 RepID=A0ABD5SZC0_9EURY